MTWSKTTQTPLATGRIARDASDPVISPPLRVADRLALAVFNDTEAYGDRWIVVVNADATPSHPHGITKNAGRRYAVVSYEPNVGSDTAELTLLHLDLTFRQAIDAAYRIVTTG